MSLATVRIAPEQLDAVETGVRNILADDDPDPLDDWKVDTDPHSLIADAAGNALLTKMTLELRLKARMFNLTHMPERFRDGHVEHLKVAGAIRTGDREAARAAMRDHIDGVEISIIRRLSEV